MTYAVLMLSLVIALLIETTSWSLRSYAKIEYRGTIISKTNIYLYGARLFILIYMTGLSFLVDKREAVFNLIMLVSFSYILSSVIHLSILNNNTHAKICDIFLRVLFVDKLMIREQNKTKEYSSSLLFNTALSAFTFSLGMIAPYFFASLYPDYRMTFGTIGQIINSLGTIFLLFFVDPILYRHMDNNRLMENLHSYYAGRILGFILGGVLILIMGLTLGNAFQ
jgi:hypothetical protein